MSFLTIEKYNSGYSIRRHNLTWKVLMALLLLVVPLAAVAAWVFVDLFYQGGAFLAQAAAGINNQITYQGKMADSSGDALADGNYGFLFQFYDNSVGGSLLWEEAWTATTTAGVVAVADGIFSVNLGSGEDISASIFANDNVYLQINFDADGDGAFEESFSPRKRIAAAPYAFNADMVDGLHATSTATAGQLLALDSSAGLTVNRATTTGKLVVGSGNPTIDNYNLYVYNQTGYGAFGESQSGYGVYGKSQSGYGVGGYSPTGYGGYFVSDSSLGVYGFSNTSYGGSFYSSLNHSLYSSNFNATGPTDRAAGYFYKPFGGYGVIIDGGNLGVNTTTPGGAFNEKLTVSGDSYFVGNATSTASISALQFCLTNDCITSWPTVSNLFNQWLDTTSTPTFAGLVVDGSVSILANTTVTEPQSYFSTAGMSLAQLEGGAFFGRTGITQNNWSLANYGEIWTAVGTSQNWHGIDMSADGRIQTAVVYGGQIYVSTDYGETWTAKDSSRNWHSVAMSADGRIQTATVPSGQIYVSTDYGETWTAKDSSRDWRDITMSADGRIQTATVTGGQIYVSTDYGETWTAKDSSRDWRDITMSADGRIQTVTIYSGQIYVSTDYGETWTAKDSSRNWNSVAMSADGRIQTATVSSGQIYVSTDYGETWTAKDSSRGWYGIAMSVDGRIQTATVSSGGQIYVSTDYGETWTAKDSSRDWLRVAMSADGRIQTAVVVLGGQIYVSYADIVMIGGNLGINTTTPGGMFNEKLTVVGNSYFQGDFLVTGQSTFQDIAAAAGTDYVCVNSSGVLSHGDSCTTIELLNEYAPQSLQPGQIQILDIVKLYYPDDHENELVAGQMREYYYKIAFDVNGVTRVGRIHVTKTIEQADDVLKALSAYVREFLKKDIFQYRFERDFNSPLYGQVYNVDLGISSNNETPYWLNPQAVNVLAGNVDSGLLSANNNLTDKLFVIEQNQNLTGVLLQVLDIAQTPILTVKNTGRVGIGTETPESALVVEAESGLLNLEEATSTKAAVIIKDKSDSADHRIALMLMKNFQDNTSADRSISMVFGSSGWGYSSDYYFGRITGGRSSAKGGEGYLAFHAGRDNDSMAQMLLDYQGNLGIGVSNPQSRLQVAGDITPAGYQEGDLGQRSLAWNNIYYRSLLTANVSRFSEFSVLDKMLNYPLEFQNEDYLEASSLPAELTEYYALQKQYDNHTSPLWVRLNIKVREKNNDGTDYFREMVDQEVSSYIDNYKASHTNPSDLKDIDWNVSLDQMVGWNYQAIHELLSYLNYSTSSSSILPVFTASEVNTAKLVVSEQAEFNGSLLVNASSTFNALVKFNDKFYVNKDQAGTVIITKAITKAKVPFESAYQYIPKVAVSPNEFLGGVDYWVSDKSTSSFSLNLSQALDKDVAFDWIALATDIEAAYVAEGETDADQPNTDNNDVVAPDVGSDQPVEPGDSADSGSDSEQTSTTTPDLSGDIATSTSPIATSTEPIAGDSEESSTDSEESNPVLGCIDETAVNYNQSATEDDGSCEYPVIGCTDPGAVNYNSEATEDDGSCQVGVLGCTDSSALNYNPEADTDDGSCEYTVLGCTDSSASNYNPEATADDGSCIIEVSAEGEVLGAQSADLRQVDATLVRYLAAAVVLMALVLSWLTIRELRRGK